jgi:hypothetical protein
VFKREVGKIIFLSAHIYIKFLEGYKEVINSVLGKVIKVGTSERGGRKTWHSTVFNIY